MDNTIPVFRPHIDLSTHQAAAEALDLGWLGMGAYVPDFDEALSAYLGLRDRHRVAAYTGPSALHLAMLLAGIEPGDEVITPSFTNIAAFQAIRAAGGTPVFCDIREDNLGIDVSKAADLISSQTK